jgi:predicted ATPase
MVLLPNLRVKNFRLFADFEMERLARVNLITGRNNTGKSTLLEAAYLAGTRNPRDALANIISNRGELDREEGWILESLFSNHQLSPEIPIDIRAGDHYFRAYVPAPEEWPNIFKRALRQKRSKKVGDILPVPIKVEYPGDNSPLYLFDKGGVDWRLRQLSIFDEPDRVYLVRGGDSLYHRYRELSAWWDEIALTSAADTVIEILQIIEPKLRKIDFLSRQDNVRVLLEGMERPIFIGSLGDGMHHLLIIALALVKAKGGLLLVDEVETGLHYSVLEDLWRLLFRAAAKLDLQIIAATHSQDSIAAFSQVWQEVGEAEGQYCRLDRVKEQIVTEFYSREQLYYAVEREIEVR